MFASIPALLFLATSALAASSSVSVSYDMIYDTSSTSLDEVACSDGPNGMITKGYSTFGSLPNYPYIGGAQAIAGYDSASCGTCWKLTYDGTSINVLAIDHTATGFNINFDAMNDLTKGQVRPDLYSLYLASIY
jgi:hypothetical protein